MAGLPVGQWVKLDPSKDSPRAAIPSGPEQGMGMVRQRQQAQGDTYYQVVWNPGDATPRSAWYKENQLTVLTQQQAQEAAQGMANGSPPDIPKQSSQYQQPEVPAQALPPSVQGLDITAQNPQ